MGLYAVGAGSLLAFPQLGGAAKELLRWGLILGLAAAFAIGYRALQIVSESARARRIVVGYAVALTLAAAFVPAFQSDDVLVYVNIGWQQAGYGVNPYDVLLYEMPTGLTDPMFCQKWQFVPCSYGFLFAIETHAACTISGPDHATAVFLMKAIAASCFLLLGWVIGIGGRAAGRSTPIRGVFLVLWNPLLLLHGVSNAHNDLQLALGVAVAVVGFLRGRWLVIFPALAAAALVKYLSVVVVPFFLVASVRRFGWWRTAASCTAALALALACWWPYRDGFDARYFSRMGSNLTAIHNSIASIATFPLEVLRVNEAEHGWLFAGIKLACWSAFAALAGSLLTARLLRRGDDVRHDLVRDSVLLLFAVLLASPKYHAWYLGMVLPLAVWLPRASRLRQALLAVGAANLLSFTFVNQTHLLNALAMLVAPLAWVLRRPQALQGTGRTALPARTPHPPSHEEPAGTGRFARRLREF
ncbi:MAG: hypothetical protein U0791_09100 [Gemmataceae bacterium]